MLRASTRDVLPEGFLSVYEQSKPKVLESMSLELSSFRDGLGAGSSGFQLSNPVQEHGWNRAGAAERSCPESTVRSSSCALLEQP